MADAELTSALKDLNLKIQTSSLKERKQVIDKVINVLTNPGMTESIIKGICRVIPLTLHRYRDGKSQYFVRLLICALIKKYPEVTTKCLIAIFTDLASQFKNVIVTDNVSQSSLYAFEWTTLLLLNAWKTEESTIKQSISQIVEAQAIFLTSVIACGKKKKADKAFSLINSVWTTLENSDVLYLNTLKSLEQTQYVVVFEAILTKRFSLKNDSSIKDHLDLFLESFVKNFITCKIAPLSTVVEACYPLLAQVLLDQFKKCVLPALQKAMLRNPEVILETVGLVVRGVDIDLSSCAMDIGSSLITNLHSKDENARKDSAQSLKYLAEKISDPKSIEELLKKTFAVYHGSDGKLTVAEHKTGVLQGAGNLSYNNVTPENLIDLISKASVHFIKVLETEVHEKTLCFALDMLALWTIKLTNEVPKALLDGFKNGMGLKSSTPLVKISYIQCMLSTFSSNSISQVVLLTSILTKSVEKAVSQPTQPLSVNEGLCAALLLIKLNGSKLEKENGLSNVWNAVLDMDKQIFVSEKFLQAANENCLPYVAQLCETLLIEFPDKIGNKTDPILKALLYCSLYPSTTIRQKCLKVVKKVVDSLGGTKVAIALLETLKQQLESEKIIFVKEGTENVIATTPSNVVECITTLCPTVCQTNEDSQQISIAALLPLHYPLLISPAPKLWIKIVKHLKLNPKNLVAQCASQLRDVLIVQYKPSQTYENALATVLSLNPDVVLPSVLTKLKKYLEDPRICQISKDDYFTFLTPEGELYDKSVIPGEENSAEMNLKRESKAYSYKEQLEELQLRRELEEKKKKEGKIKPPSYTAKQLEAIKNQRVKEEGIRKRLNELNEFIVKSVSMINAAAKGCPLHLSLHYKDLLPLLLQDLQSPLASPYLTKLFTDLRTTVFDRDLYFLGEIISIITLRLSRPQCDLDSNWEAEDLNEAMVRVVTLIHSRTVSSDIPNARFSAPAFSYTFPFLKYSLTSFYAKNNEEFVHDGLQIISEHAKLRGNDDSSEVDVFHPQYLPTRQMFALLVDIICNSSGRVQAQSEACLLEVARALSGEAGCVIASLDEIDVLLTALQNPTSVVRDAALRALIIMVSCLPNFDSDYEYTLKLNKRIWIAKFDETEENRDLAAKLWSTAGMTYPATLSTQLMADIEHPVECVQAAAAQALAALLKEDLAQVEPTLKSLLKLYSDRLKMIPAKLDEFGREIEKAIDTWFPRRGVALAIAQLAPLITPELVGDLMKFFVFTSLSDRNEIVRKEMLNAALKIVDLHGKETVGILWPVFDNFMGKSSKSAHFDAVKQAVVVLMGTLARHLDKEDQRIKPIVTRLIQALSTPSQTVQEAVANCLPPLVQSVKEEAPGYVNKLLHQLLKGDKYGERKGAAYGLAGMVKGMGILALKQHEIMSKLTDAVQDKKNYKHREGALFAFEMLFQMLGKLFEPYIVHVLPHLLQCFGDTSQYVRTAADDTAKVVMSKLSGHGVKLVLPSLLDALEEDSWRTKTGSVELLGAMAYCAPKQLSSCLPSIVPKLIEVLSDSHMKVQEAGADALKVIGSVIRNPEIQAIVPTLLKALQDPSNKTSVCLQTLLDTQFVHFIDAPSLALIMPVVQRAFMDRSTETRKMAAQIIGNMYSLTDQKDLFPYLPTIIPGLKTSLLDPVPEVRSVSARALGAMVKGMGESSFEDLLPWLMTTLTSETSSVDRSGAAQGLSEVVGGLGVEKLHKLMPEIISTAERTDIAPHVKDGYIMMFIYMPVVFTEEFTPYIGQIINPILKALADENEYVRETALKAGQRIVNLYADSAILLLLPELERGLFDENWRIRYSSVQLLGDLLYRISGVTGKMSTETASEDDNFGTEQSHMAIIRSLGSERRNRVLAGLYMGRSDVALMVRQSALHVWKVVVTNTPRTLREILPTLFSLLLGCLASESYDKRQVAARTLGDLVRKLGERVLPEIIPILEKGLQSDQPDQRQGVCIGLSEIMASTSRDMVLTFVNSLVPTVRKALCDPLPEVRQAAAKTFDSLHSTVGSRALDDILPTLLNQLNDDNPEVVECTLDGLRQVMAIKSRVVLPYLVPQLTAPPANTKALSILASVAGEALNKYLPKILPALQTALATSKGTPDEVSQLEYCQAVVLSVVDDMGIRTIIDTMLENTRNQNADQRRAAATLLCGFCANSKAQYTAHVPQLLRGLIHLCTDSDRDVLQMSWEALNAVTKTLEPKQQATYVSDVRQAVRFAMSDMKGTSDVLPGFCLSKGIAPILPIFREAILGGDGDEKEAAAQGLGEIIKVTSASALQPSVVAITGPLIRILGDRFSANVKTAVLETLAILLAKVGPMLRQFLPQLQTTFVKALNDPNRVVRLKSASALSYLIVIHQRADPLFTEIHSMIKNNEDPSIKETTLHALRGITSPAGDKMSEPIKKQIYATLVSYLGQPDDTIRKCAAGCLGAICKYLSPEQLDVTLTENILNDDNSLNVTLREGRGSALTVALKEAPERLWDDQYRSKLTQTILSQIQSPTISITQSAIRSCGYLIEYLLKNEEPIPSNLLVPFVRAMNNASNDVKQLLARVCFHLAKVVPQEKMSPEFLKLLLPTLVNGTKEKNIYVKANSEIALIAVLKLKEGDTVFQKYSAILDVGARESLSDVVSKVLKKILHQPEGKEEDIDDTLLT
ncbi:eIF-2-alpha kinase activator GCN1 isoform X2 [Sitophilus oryzae]|uniref:EIF-2-alpha kinase activator GCN1 isoform X2 n=1 Tax=Sitophilus oryzae TaxID=7048 RepID=A0A6J2YFD3_SITOR|nr:eIF-2-alpha kinase activator GCN1 isoform X2 [Sitophilus oryzae]